MVCERNMSSSVEIPKEYCTPEGLRTIAQYLRSSSNLKVKSAIQYEKRVDYFRGMLLHSCVICCSEVSCFSNICIYLINLTLLIR